MSSISIWTVLISFLLICYFSIWQDQQQISSQQEWIPKVDDCPKLAHPPMLWIDEGIVHGWCFDSYRFTMFRNSIKFIQGENWIKLSFVGANQISPQPLSNQSKLHVHRGQYHGQVELLSSVLFPSLYSGIDFELYVDNTNHLAYQFHFDIDADPSQIETKIESNGKIPFLAETDFQIVHKQNVYPAKNIKWEYSKHSQSFHLSIPLAKQLSKLRWTLDPSWTTYFGGSGVDLIVDMLSWDSENFFFVLGTTTSVDFPTTSFAFNDTLMGNRSVFVSKIGTDGVTLFWSTLLTSDGDDEARRMLRDPFNQDYIWIVGSTTGVNGGEFGFPVQNTSLFLTCDVPTYHPFLAKINHNGMEDLQWSSIICSGRTIQGNIHGHI